MDAALESTVSELRPLVPAPSPRIKSGGLFAPALGSVAVHALAVLGMLGARQVAYEPEALQPDSHMIDFELPRALEVTSPEPVPQEVKAVVRTVRAKPIAVPDPATPPPASEPPPPAPAPASAAPAVVPDVPPLAAHAVAEGGSLAVTSGTGTGIAGSAPKVLPAAVGGGGALVGGIGTGKIAIDQSRAPMLAGSAHWNDCPFPSDAYDAGIDEGTVKLQVKINATGGVDSVTVLSDPGYGFGHEARRCALRKRWQAGLDRAGQPTTAVAIVNARFAQR